MHRNKDDDFEHPDVYDECDIASAVEMGMLNHALEKHKEKLIPETHPDFDGKHCIECDTDIPDLRLGMGKIRCVDCQSELEIRSKMYAKKD